MWSRPKLKEEAKKVFTFSSENYWRMVLAGLIIALLSGGIGGSISGAIGSVTGSFGKDRNDKHKIYEYESFESSNGDYGTWKYDYYDDDVDVDIELDPDEILKNRPHSSVDNAASYGIMGLSILMIVMLVLIVTIISLAIGLTFKAFVINPLILGCKSLFLNSYERPADLKDLGNGFKNQYMKNVGTLILKDIFVILWSLLLIVPGIIKAYEYRMIPYLIAENPNMTYQEAFARSKEMMMGNKWDAFVFDLSYLGWMILSYLTCGILGIFYVNPYYFAADANLYRIIKMGGNVKVENSAV